MVSVSLRITSHDQILRTRSAVMEEEEIGEDDLCSMEFLYECEKREEQDSILIWKKETLSELLQDQTGMWRARFNMRPVMSD